MAVLPDMIQESKATLASIQAELESLKAENAALRARSHRSLSLKVTEKGGVSVYGLGRFPVSLYQGQWTKLLGAKDDILAFIEANKAQLSTKD